jgi:hypothetical protein
MINNDQELRVTLHRIAKFQEQVKGGRPFPPDFFHEFRRK